MGGRAVAGAGGWLLSLVPLERRAHFVLSASAGGDLPLHGVLPSGLALRHRLGIELVWVPDDDVVAAFPEVVVGRPAGLVLDRHDETSWLVGGPFEGEPPLPSFRSQVAL